MSAKQRLLTCYHKCFSEVAEIADRLMAESPPKVRETLKSLRNVAQRYAACASPEECDANLRFLETIAKNLSGPPPKPSEEERRMLESLPWEEPGVPHLLRYAMGAPYILLRTRRRRLETDKELSNLRRRYVPKEKSVLNLLLLG